MTNQQRNTWQFIFKSLQRNGTVFLMYVVESKGSSPGRQGFFMAIDEQGNTMGSIGGGIMEHKFTELAKNYLKTNERVSLLKKQVHTKNTATDQSGMICSGEQTIFLHTISSESLSTVEQILTNNAVSLVLSAAGLAVKNSSDNCNFNYYYNNSADWYYEEKLSYQHHLHIIGGGHCSLALSKLMSSMNFFISVYEDRENVSTFINNTYANAVIKVNDYSDLTILIEPEPITYVIIMTVGYRTDAVAFEALMHKSFNYIKMLGSKNKLFTMCQLFQQKGMTEERINCLLQPAGISINSQTPEEIAISIAADIIAVKNDAYKTNI
jgi:xanthine dehydrogenase accessory factor